MLERLDEIPWAEIEHAYGPATDVPELLRELLDPDPKVRSGVLKKLYGNVFHQGTRFPAAPYVIPFLIELCAEPTVPARGDILGYWGSLITGYFSVQERPMWGDGTRINLFGEVRELGDQEEADRSFVETLHQIYLESLKGFDLIIGLLDGDEAPVRSGAAWVLACLPTRADDSVPALEARLLVESSGWVQAAIAFALGELGAPDPLRRIIAEGDFPAARCMAACQLARIAPDEGLIDTLLPFIAEPIEGYQNIPGAGGKSSGDAAFSITHLPQGVRRKAVSVICDRLDHTRSIDTLPLVRALFSAAFEPRNEPLVELTEFQREVLTRMIHTEELWSIGNLHSTFETHGLSQDREKCAELAGVKVVNDEALASLRWGLRYAQMGRLEKGRNGILEAIALDPAVFERVPAPDESWLLCAKAFADTDPDRALAAFGRACAINPAIRGRVGVGWRLADLLAEDDDT